MNILYEDNHIIVLEKPINIPVQADVSQDKDFTSIIKEYIKVKYNKPGEVYLGLVHRLDRPVGGVMIFARTSKAAARLSKQIKDRQLEKKYVAVVEGKVKQEETWIDFLQKNEKTNTSYASSTGKESILSYKSLAHKEGLSLVEIELKTGRSHQIRVQFSSRNHPLYGDQRYNKNASKGQQIALFSKSITFHHPITKEMMYFVLPLPERKPFTYFH